MKKWPIISLFYIIINTTTAAQPKAIFKQHILFDDTFDPNDDTFNVTDITDSSLYQWLQNPTSPLPELNPLPHPTPPDEITNIIPKYDSHELIQRPKKQTKKSSHPCSQCPKCFSSKSSLERHMLSHSDERFYPCNLCDKSFKRETHLKRHMDNVHSQKRPYPCPVCEQTFKLPHHLQGHLALHADEKPFKCNICEKTFTRKSILNDHNKTHLSEEELIALGFQCIVCKKVCTKKYNLIDHMKRKHPYM